MLGFELGWTDGCKEGRVLGCITGWMEGCFDGLLLGCIDGLEDGCMLGCIDSSMELQVARFKMSNT